MALGCHQLFCYSSFFLQVIPFSPHDYTVVIEEYIDKLNFHLLNIKIAEAFGIDDYHQIFWNLKDATKRFRKVADSLQNFIHVNSFLISFIQFC